MVDECAHDRLLEVMLNDVGLPLEFAQRAVTATAEWAKDQDEDWPWDDGTPAPPTTDWSQHPSITDPHHFAPAMADYWALVQRHLARALCHQGTPATFQAATHRELGHPVDENTQALTAHWARQQATDGSVVPWQPSVRICPERATTRPEAIHTGETWGDD